MIGLYFEPNLVFKDKKLGHFALILNTAFKIIEKEK